MLIFILVATLVILLWTRSVIHRENYQVTNPPVIQCIYPSIPTHIAGIKGCYKEPAYKYI